MVAQSPGGGGGGSSLFLPPPPPSNNGVIGLSSEPGSFSVQPPGPSAPNASGGSATPGKPKPKPKRPSNSPASRSATRPARVAGAPKGMSAQDWALVKQVGAAYHIDPMVLVAIGMHETQWGTLGAGQQGYTLGVGVPDSGAPQSQYAGLKQQLLGAARILSRNGVHNIQDIAAGKLAPRNGQVIYASDPAWSSGVVSMYNSLTGGHATVPSAGSGGVRGAAVSGTASSTAAGTVTGTDNPGYNQASRKLTAADFGFVDAFFNSDPSLKNLLNQAIKNGWTDAEFEGRLKATSWWQKHTDAQRTYLQTLYNDPATAKRQLAQMSTQVSQTAASIGVTLSGADVQKMAHDALYNGWSTNEVKTFVAAKLTLPASGHFGGEAGQVQDQLEQTAGDYGLSGVDTGTWARRVEMGQATPEDFHTWAQTQAKSMFPGLSKLIDQGVTVRDAADPYVRSMANTLEVDPSTIDITKDPTVRRALQYQTPTSGSSTTEPGVMPLWQFEQQLRNDPRWLKTDNARNSLMDAGTTLLKNMGLI